ncbi:cobaltochelatase subunit CobN [Phycicoccus endophyticus]|uniref:Cobaltochelatase subunit CobN n=1 Tax=Phycicoccus endophyticus TaxID=1690220 RepID=A0A7G9R3M9_9MICO|nr:cobaltochelatase subunit CobN [Phycicoccus endophyticus]NHI18020.1 cobaltochelatase subunit CobN [Phycicoccus endophyticus]QNN50204.1 cobaltochelatase subunit CobN [Phycicoccus endophyticus]
MPRIALLSTSDTDLLSARASGADFVVANPTRPGHADLAALLESADVVVARILGTPEDLCSGFARIRQAGVPVVVVGGEQAPNAQLMAESTAPQGVVREAHEYLRHGGAGNLAQLHAFLSDTLLLTGEGFEAPVELPGWGVLERPAPEPSATPRPRVGILFYRAQYAAGNTAYVHALADAVDAAGGVGEPVFATSLRDAPAGLLEQLATYDAVVTTVLAAGGSRPASASAGGEDEAWDVARLAALDVPLLQGLCLTWSRAQWAAAADGMSPLDVATQVAIPEFDGRVVTVPFSFKETDEEGLARYVADPERCARVAGIALGHARLRHVPPAKRKVAVVLSAYPTKHSRIGNAVGLDTPVSTVRLLRMMRAAGYDLGEPGAVPGLDPLPPVEGEAPDTTAGNALVHALIAAGGQDPEWLTETQLTEHHVRIPAARYREWFERFPQDLRDAVTQAWGEAPGEVFVDHSGAEPAIVTAALRAGNVVVLVQPPRGFGENPIAIYHDPDLAPSHHYLATYRWLEEEFGAHAVVHMGKHGNLEWLPGKNLAMSASCGTDAALGSLPLVYPFLVNDPGEGTQAKRRAHATVVDHLVPPMARAESYGDIARLEQLLDEYGNVSVMDPAKAPALRGEIWTLIQAAQLHHDLGIEERPDEETFDDFVMHVDGWLCEVKDVQIRDGLHVLGQPPEGQALVDLVLAVLRATQVFGGRRGAVPGLRTALGLAEGASSTARTDEVEARARELVEALAGAGWDAGSVPALVAGSLGEPDPGVEASLTFACEEVVPRLRRTTDELAMVLHALEGGYVPAGPSGSPLRGLVNVLPTGRNFYSVDPKAIPSRLAYETGTAMADSLLARYREDHGGVPQSVGLSAWGTSAMRTSGDDLGEVLALLGVTPVWDEQSRRVVGLEAIALEELGRPRVDVTVRISGFFRDAFPHVVDLLDDAVALVVGLEEPLELNHPRAHALADEAEHGDARRARTRIFGSKPGSYGAGVLEVLEQGSWRDDADLAEVYTAWGGFAYGRDLDGAPAREDMERSYRRIQVAAKNVDNRESDILDSDDYFQYHGGMVATVRALTGTAPTAYVGDSTTPDLVRTRTLHEETSRVFRARVVNPRWVAAMRRHGYKGAFELAATVDYLFGFDATTGVVEDWMYDRVAREYVTDEETQAFLRHANPWALRGIVEKLSEAADRGLWQEPDPGLLAEMHRVYLEVEGDIEAGQEA